MSDPGGLAGPAVPPPAPDDFPGPQMPNCRRILEDRTAAAGARQQQGRAFRHASRRAVPIISVLAESEDEPAAMGGRRGGGLGHAGLHSAEQERLYSRRQRSAACPMSSIRDLSWPSQWRFQISAQIHPKFELASQSVVIKKAHPKLCGPNTYNSYRRITLPSRLSTDFGPARIEKPLFLPKTRID
jgi:hypothetical protein